MRACEEWVISEVEHLPLVSDELFAEAQERFRHRSRPKGLPRPPAAGDVRPRAQATHLPVLRLWARLRQDRRRTDRRPRQWLYLREDALLPLVEQFFAQRIFGPMRLQKLTKQLRAHQRQTKRTGGNNNANLRRHIADLDRRIGLQLNALEQGIEPDLIGQRIGQLRA